MEVLLYGRTGMFCRLAGAGVSVVGLLSVAGCSGPAVPVRYEPAKSAEVAISAFDANGDGKLDAKELDKSPGLKSAMSRIDTDGDKHLSAAEIEQRLQAYESQSDFVGAMVQITRDKRPVQEATLTLQPESFMGENAQSYTGVSDSGGMVSPAGEQSDTPGFPLGFYRVIIKSADGVEVIQGCEVADDVPSSNRMVFEL